MDSQSNLFILVNFKILAETEFGDSVSLTGNVPELGKNSFNFFLFFSVTLHQPVTKMIRYLLIVHYNICNNATNRFIIK